MGIWRARQFERINGHRTPDSLGRRIIGRAPLSRAIVLAGGHGMRLRPYTAVIPKPLMPVGDRPVLDIVIRQLKCAGLDRVTIATGYLAELIEAFFGDGSAYGLRIDYFREQRPLGTVGALAFIEDLDAPFIVMNGDVLTDLDYRELVQRHAASDAIVTIAVTRRRVDVSLGVIDFDERDADRIAGYVEKPSIHVHASMGVYCFSPRVREHIVPGERLDFPDLVLRLLERGEVVRSWKPDAFWLDIGDHEDHERAVGEFERNRDRFLRVEEPPRPAGLATEASIRRRAAAQTIANVRRRPQPLRALATGGAGFIGSHLLDALLAAGHGVSVVDNLATGRRENVDRRARLHDVNVTSVDELHAGFAAERPDADAVRRVSPGYTVDPSSGSTAGLSQSAAPVRASPRPRPWRCHGPATRPPPTVTG